MNVLEKIKVFNNEDLKNYVSLSIKELEDNSKKLNAKVDTIGYVLDYNPSAFNLNDKDNNDELKIDVECLYNGYIPKGTRMVYGMIYNKKKIAKNGGLYYYINDDSYILDFCRFIREKEVYNEYELFSYILEFIKDYFGWIEILPRDEMFNMFYKNSTTFYNPINEHYYSDFKRKGNALCSEISIMAQNILSFFEFNSFIIIGYQETEKEDKNGLKKVEDGENHAYNLLSFNDSETGELTEILIDFANWVPVLNTMLKRIGCAPYIAYLNDGIEQAVQTICSDRNKISCEEYSYMKLKNEVLEIVSKRIRNYSIDIVIDNDIKKYTKIKTK